MIGHSYSCFVCTFISYLNPLATFTLKSSIREKESHIKIFEWKQRWKSTNNAECEVLFELKVNSNRRFRRIASICIIVGTLRLLLLFCFECKQVSCFWLRVFPKRSKNAIQSRDTFKQKKSNSLNVCKMLLWSPFRMFFSSAMLSFTAKNIYNWIHKYQLDLSICCAIAIVN